MSDLVPPEQPTGEVTPLRPKPAEPKNSPANSNLAPHWQPGQSGNPAGRPRARKRDGARCLRIEISNAEQTLDAFVKIGVLGRNDDRAIEAAISVLCKRDIAPSKPNDRRIEITIDDPARGGRKEGATPCFEA